MRARTSLLALSLLLVAAPASAAPGVVIVAATPSRNGTASIHVEVNDARTLGAMQAAPPAVLQSVAKSGQSRVVKSERLADTGEPIYTLLAFDASASFQPYRASAIAAAHSFVDALPAKIPQRTVVMTFGVGSSSPKENTTAAASHGAIDAVRTAPAQPATRLKSSISEAVQTAGAAQPMPTGIRQVVVFTDAGEESRAYSIASIIQQARASGVLVHVVVFKGTAQNSPTFAQYRDELRQLAEASGGHDIAAQDVATAKTALSEIARTSEATWRLDLAFCGVQPRPAAFDDELTVEVTSAGSTLARSAPYLFQQQGSGPATAPCAPASCASGGPCPSASASAVPTPRTTAGESSSALRWVLIAIGAGALACLIAGLVWASRKRRPPPVATYRPMPAPVSMPSPMSMPTPPAAPGPVAAPMITPSDPFQVLPDTRLVVLRALPGAPAYYRVSQPVFHIGARPDMSVVIDHEMVSGHHAFLELQPDGSLFVSDVGSTNGTFVDGTRLSPGERRRVVAGQRVGISRVVEFRVEQPGLAAAQPQGRPSAAAVLGRAEAVDGSPVAEGPGKKGRTRVEPEDPWKGRS
ncbi:MAG: FHA domain-containing protein [Deltaproteobacteria bacterium]|nr:FHA domain-containing protein [Deltaproteobacteria bacterium]